MESEESQQNKRIKLELADRPLNFSISPEDYEMPTVKKPKVPRDPMSHRIIEKRRRDRMNNCLADLSRLIPSNYLNQGQGRIEKTEIIEMATRHITHLQNLFKIYGDDNHPVGEGKTLCCKGKFYLGFKDCQDEVIRFFVEEEGWDTKDPLCVKIMNHLEQASQKLIQSSAGIKLQNGEILVDDNSNQSSISNIQATSLLPMEMELSPLSSMNCSKINKSVNTMTQAGSTFGDQHLRTLLMPQDKDSGCSSLGSDHSSVSILNLENLNQGSGIYQNYIEGKGDNDSVTDKANSFGDSDVSSVTSSGFINGRRDNVYKFKHNITKRFSQEERYNHIPSSDTSSSSSREDGVEKVKRKFFRHKSESPSSDSTPYPQSDSSSPENGNRTTEKEVKNANENFMQNSDLSSSCVPLPAFVLHPVGTHYVPMSIHRSLFESVFSINDSHSDSQKSSSVFHPISIPVNFAGPCVSMKSGSTDTDLVKVDQAPCSNSKSKSVKICFS